MNYGPSTRAANRLWRRMALMALIACAGVIFAAGGPTGCGVLVGAAAGGAAGYAVGSASSDSSDQPSEKPIR